MTETPSLQTVITVTAGASPVPQSIFVWGTPTRPFAVGTHGDWIVTAPGVAPVHLFLQFDGKMIHVASGPTGAPVLLSGAPVDQTWRPVPVFSEIVFGGARMRVNCEPAPARRSDPPVARDVPYAPHVPHVPVPNAPARAHEPPRLDSTAPLGGVRRVKTDPIVLPGAGQGMPGGSAPPPPMIRESQPSPAAQGRDPAATLLSPRAGHSEMSEVPSVRQALPSESEFNSTLSDAGALKAHAKRVVSDPQLARISADAYLEQVRKAAGLSGSAPPPRMADAQLPTAQGNAPTGPTVPRVPSAPPAAALVSNVADGPDQETGKHEKGKQKTSWVMRVTLVLLPFAGYLAVFYEPGGEAPPPPEVTASAPTASVPAPIGSAAPNASAASNASTTPAGSATSAPSATASVSPATSASTVATPGAPSPPKATKLANADVPPTSNRQRDALNAAFEGKLDEALAHYDELATGPDAQVYVSAARFIRERAFRKP